MSWSSMRPIKLTQSILNQLSIGSDNLNDSEPSIGTNDMNDENGTNVYLTVKEAYLLAKTVGKLEAKMQWVENDLDYDLSKESYREIIENLEKILEKIHFN